MVFLVLPEIVQNNPDVIFYPVTHKQTSYKNYKTMNEDEDRDYVDQDDIKISGKFRKRDKDKKAVLNYLVKPSGPKSAKFASRI